MGTVLHRAIIVTCYKLETLGKACEIAGDIFPGGSVSGLIPSPVSGFWSFLIASRGSKMGWSDEADHRRCAAEFDKRMKRFAFEDGSSSLEIVYVTYGNDLDEAEPSASLASWAIEAPSEE